MYGRIDDDLYELASIEAASVYVENLNTYFYASADDEEDAAMWVSVEPLVVGSSVLRGTVTSVDAAEREFTIDTDNQTVTVEAEFIGYNPFDDRGYQKIETGDQVSVSGMIDYDFFEGRVFEADSIITLSDNDSSQKSNSQSESKESHQTASKDTKQNGTS